MKNPQDMDKQMGMMGGDTKSTNNSAKNDGLCRQQSVPG